MDEDDNKESIPVIPISRNYNDDTSTDRVAELAKEVENMGKLLKSIIDDNSKKDCHQHCCSSKNIKFMVKLPSEKRVLKSKKCVKRKLKKIKRLNSKNSKAKSSKKRNCLSNDNWQVEDCLENMNHQVSDRNKNKVISEGVKSLGTSEVAHPPGYYVKIPPVSDNNELSSESQDLVRYFST